MASISRLRAPNGRRQRRRAAAGPCAPLSQLPLPIRTPSLNPLWSLRRAGLGPSEVDLFLLFPPRRFYTRPPRVDPTPMSRDLISLLPCLQLIVCSSAGVEHVDLLECRRQCITATNAGKAFSSDVADLAVGLLSCSPKSLRQLPLGRKRVGIVGLGTIGAEIAKGLESFGWAISYNSRRKKPSVPCPSYKNVHDLAINSDVLIVCCALTEETQHIISKHVMNALGKEGMIINVGRGALIDETELLQLLVKVELGAAFDVFENEPDVPEELFSLNNVVLFPHYAVATPECFDALKRS